MSRNSPAFVCSACGAAQPRWLGRCPSCGEWGTLAETGAGGGAGAAGESLATVDPLQAERTSTGSAELDRVLGGGLVRGSLVLLAGEPGIGKSTLALQMTRRPPRTLYVAGEESAGQIKLRADRLGISGENVTVATASTVEALAKTAEAVHPDLLIVDSIQTIGVAEAEGALGAVNQLRAAAAALLRLAKSANLPALLVGHVTKTGDVAGPMLLEHLVDVVLLLETDDSGQHRLLRGLKNRFGATDEVGLFTMTESGLQDLTDPSGFLLPATRGKNPGSAIVASLEGRRPLLLEIQALTVATAFGLPRRVATGVDANRLSMLLAVLERRGGIAVGQDDVYVNTAGGLKLKETAVDLAVIAAVAAAKRDRTLPGDACFCGEVGLGGEVRPASRLELRLKEAASLGMKRAYVPKQPLDQVNGLALQPVADVQELICLLFK